MRPTEKKLLLLVSKNGYKLTSQRKAVLSAIAGSHEHLTSADVYQRAKQINSTVGLVTVYRTMELLSNMGMICRVHDGGKSRSYTLAPSGHHHHMVCSECGVVADFANCDLGELEKRLSTETGFEINGHTLEFSGRCSSCRNGD